MSWFTHLPAFPCDEWVTDGAPATRSWPGPVHPAIAGKSYAMPTLLNASKHTSSIKRELVVVFAFATFGLALTALVASASPLPAAMFAF